MIPASITLKGLWAAIIAAAFVLLLVLLAVQTVRIEGLKLWPLSYKGLAERVADYEEAERREQDALKREEEQYQAAGSDYEKEASNAAQITTIREREINTIYRNVEVPAVCAVPDDARRVLAEAVASANSAASGEPVSALPTTADTP